MLRASSARSARVSLVHRNGVLLSTPSLLQASRALLKTAGLKPVAPVAHTGPGAVVGKKLSAIEEAQDDQYRAGYPWWARAKIHPGLTILVIFTLQALIYFWYNKDRMRAASAGRSIPYAQANKVPASHSDRVSALRDLMKDGDDGRVIVTGGQNALRGDTIRAAAADAKARYLSVTMPQHLSRTSRTEAADPMWLPKAFLVALGFDPDSGIKQIYSDSFLHRALQAAGKGGPRPVLHIRVPGDAAPEPYEAAVVFAIKMSRIATVVIDTTGGVAGAESDTVRNVMRYEKFNTVSL